MIQKILITGANGFIGKYLTLNLLEEGHSVHCAVRSPKKAKELAKEASVHYMADISIDSDWSDALRDIDVVIHLAARVHQLNENQEKSKDQYHATNVLGTRRLADEAVKNGVRLFIFASSVKAMGESSGDDIWTENSECLPEDMYGSSKLEAEKEINSAAENTGMSVVNLRLPLVYGPGVGANMRSIISIVKKGAPLPFGMVKNRRSMLFAGNLSDAISKIIRRTGTVRNTYLISDGDDVSTASLIKSIASAMKKRTILFPVPIALLKILGKSGDFARNYLNLKVPVNSEAISRLTENLALNIEKIKAEYEWKPPYSFSEGMKITVDSIYAQGSEVISGRTAQNN